VIRSAGL